MYCSSNLAQDITPIQKIISIDSIFRASPERYLSTSFIYNLSEPITNIQSITVKSCEIPIHAIYPVSETNESNRFIIRSLGIEYPIQIDSGFYDASTMTETLNRIFQTTTGLETLQYSINPISNISVFTTTALDISFEFQFSSFEKNSNRYKKYDQVLGGYLGYRAVEPYICTAETPIYSESTFGTSIQNYVFLNIIDYSDAWNIEETTLLTRSYTNQNNKYLMGRISLQHPDSSVYTTRHYYGRGTKIHSFRIDLVDKHGIAIDLNNNDFSFLLEIMIAK